MKLRGDLQSFPLAQLIQTLDSSQRSCGQKDGYVVEIGGIDGRSNIHISLVDPLILLAVIFDSKVPIGAISFWAKKISGSIRPVLEKMASSPRQEPSQDLSKGLQDEIDNPF